MILRHVTSAAFIFAVAAMCSVGGARLGLAAQSTQPTFPTAAAACEGLMRAVQNNDAQSIERILGNRDGLASSGDQTQDKADRELFIRKYGEMHRLGQEADHSMVLYLGAENWPFPIPIVQDGGVWRFDSDAGAREVMFRRIGENEEMAIDVCREFVAGTHADQEPVSLLKKAGHDSGKPEPVLYHGYYFRVLTPQATGALRLLAYPAVYRSSGVMTFVVAGGAVYEKDLGADTAAVGNGTKPARKDSTWHVAGD